MTVAGRIFLKAGRDGPVRGGNPWIFSQAIGRVEPAAMKAGDWVEVLDAGGDTVGLGYYNPATTIAVRMLSFDAVRRVEVVAHGRRVDAGSAAALDAGWAEAVHEGSSAPVHEGSPVALRPGDIIRHRISRALALRQRIIGGDTDCYRLINGDGDGLSGVVVDRYGGVLVVQLLTAGADRMRDGIVDALTQIVAPRSIIERSHGAVRKQEGLGDHAALLAGAPPGETIAIEHGIRLAIDFDRGQKTGAFLDQRDNRSIVRELAHGSRVLDAYCYAGGFTLAALAGDARATVAIDSSERALAMARRNLELNGYRIEGNRGDRVELVHGDVMRYLADFAEAGEAKRFDVIVLDPPPLARSLKDVAHAARLYTDLNAFAMRALAPGGYLMTFSCSIHFGGEDFVRAVRIAQTKSGRKLQMLARLGPGADHPVLLGHAEGEYLTGLLLADLQ
jgi:23S rRNA (cytosine1962-C5)-methyltransferase